MQGRLAIALGLLLLIAAGLAWRNAQSGESDEAMRAEPAQRSEPKADPEAELDPVERSLERASAAPEERAPLSGEEAAGPPTHDLVVKLVGKTGRAVDGHPLYVWPTGGTGIVPDHEKLYRRTDANGLAVFARDEVEALDARLGPMLLIQLATRHPDPVRRTIPATPIPQEPVVLEADLGRLVVRAREPNGELYTASTATSW
ncbi:MAG: hypothetical protein GY711_02830 [bacterium]|nr:hypothetical protein [bacterium]